MPEPRNLLCQVFDYIGEQLKSIDPRGFNLANQVGWKIKALDIQNKPGVTLNIQVPEDHIWLRVSRLEEQPSPRITNEEFKDLIEVRDNPFSKEPEIIESALLQKIIQKFGDEFSQEERDRELVQLRTSLKVYLDAYKQNWRSWALAEKPRRETIKLYSDLFALKNQMESEEASKPSELVWGIGVSAWKMQYEGGLFDYQYPLITQAVEISLEENMDIELRSRSLEPRIEIEPFIAASIAGAADLEYRGKAQLTSNPERVLNPFDSSTYQDVLKMLSGGIQSKGTYEETIEPKNFLTPTDNFNVTDLWVIFTRPKNNSYLQADLERLIKKLEEGCEIPLGSLALVTPPSDDVVRYETINFRGVSSRGNGSGSKPKELFFPLPYNQEQVTIIQQLESSPGVTVQGPPGTGKTHTIANIICHYLATGKRVLVTSKGEPALKVLQEKIPEDVRHLTVALLTNDRQGMAQFEKSISSIQHGVSQIHPQIAREEIDILKNKIDLVHSELIKIDRRVDEIALAQLSDVEVDGQKLRAQKMADLVVSGQDLFGWFRDELTLDQSNAIPIDLDQENRLRDARRFLKNDITYLDVKVPVTESLPTIDEIAKLHETLSKIKELNESESSGKLLPITSSTEEIFEVIRRMLLDLEKAREIALDFETEENSWPFLLRKSLRNPSFNAEKLALEALFNEIDHLINARLEFLQKPIDFPEEGIRSAKVKQAIIKAISNGKPFSLFSFIGNGDIKKLVTVIRVSGLPPSSQEDWAHIKKYLDLDEKLITFTTRWNQIADSLGIPQLEGGILFLRNIERMALLAKKAHDLATNYDKSLSRYAEKIFKNPPLIELHGGLNDLNVVRQHLNQHLFKQSLNQATINLRILQAKLSDCSGDITEKLKVFTEKILGDKDLPQITVTSQYANLIAELKRVNGLSSYLKTISELSKYIQNSGGIKLAQKLRTDPVDQSDQDLALPLNWREAWNWARIRNYLDQIEARSELVEMYAKRRAAELNLARLYKEMVAKEAWLSTKNNASPRVLQALSGYATAIKRIGKGTGTNAPRYRRDARTAMLDAQGAIPCWIMSHGKISESMPSEFGVFDLVIVDEASQSDLLALPAIVRGKKVLVVGDDKQVSPDAGFIKSTHIDNLINRFLRDMPYKQNMTPESSLYDLAARVYAGNQVMLREHFRCVPAIIEYSNKTFYQHEILPLRIPKATERLDPPLVDVYVTEGLKSDRNTNRLEAEFIAEEIGLILANHEMQERTIGVVSLLGFEQAKLIDSIVRERYSAAELMKRDFACGDAKTFQGSERDIVFLSMVIDRNSSYALSGNQYEQRFNVAASRARDRMYLVRSIQFDELSAKDLRRTLLEHFDKPLVADIKDTAELIDLCESGFEREVFKLLSDKGYKVTPQVKSGSFSIDMVVEGAGDARLAIELDGDDFHGPERWQADMTRQRILERAGWEFWRCFASTWSLNKDMVFNELINELTSRGIQPLGALTSIPSLVLKRTWVFGSKTSNPETEVEVVSDSPSIKLSIDKVEEVIENSPLTFSDENLNVDPQSNQDGSSEISASEELEKIKALAVGDIVSHPKFGEGRILALNGDEPSSKIDIYFESFGKKTLVLDFAKLRDSNGDEVISKYFKKKVKELGQPESILMEENTSEVKMSQPIPVIPLESLPKNNKIYTEVEEGSLTIEYLEKTDPSMELPVEDPLQQIKENAHKVIFSRRDLSTIIFFLSSVGIRVEEISPDSFQIESNEQFIDQEELHNFSMQLALKHLSEISS
ncbi:AAA domain-containing protein [Polynucleobacter rarus]|uniref:AAA domain-containing protein n=1 Tax=Polynucleobacter rarus TaxID=556055 RepID=UPI000D3E70D0|nr:AAA domain-containing protein [Polynucleobacter rarus]